MKDDSLRPVLIGERIDLNFAQHFTRASAHRVVKYGFDSYWLESDYLDSFDGLDLVPIADRADELLVAINGAATLANSAY